MVRPPGLPRSRRRGCDVLGPGGTHARFLQGPGLPQPRPGPQGALRARGCPGASAHQLLPHAWLRRRGAGHLPSGGEGCARAADESGVSKVGSGGTWGRLFVRESQGIARTLARRLLVRPFPSRPPLGRAVCAPATHTHCFPLGSGSSREGKRKGMHRRKGALLPPSLPVCAPGRLGPLPAGPWRTSNAVGSRSRSTRPASFSSGSSVRGFLF